MHLSQQSQININIQTLLPKRHSTITLRTTRLCRRHRGSDDAEAADLIIISDFVPVGDFRHKLPPDLVVAPCTVDVANNHLALSQFLGSYMSHGRAALLQALDEEGRLAGRGGAGPRVVPLEVGVEVGQPRAGEHMRPREHVIAREQDVPAVGIRARDGVARRRHAAAGQRDERVLAVDELDKVVVHKVAYLVVGVAKADKDAARGAAQRAHALQLRG